MRVSIFITAFLLVVVSAHPAFADQEKESAAVSAVESFLQLVDSGQYPESWDAASTVFKTKTSKQKWDKQLKGVRPFFGNVIKRTIKEPKYTTTLSGAPDGEYFIIQFLTEFENKKSALETVMPMLEKDGKWRVSGYYIQ